MLIKSFRVSNANDVIKVFRETGLQLNLSTVSLTTIVNIQLRTSNICAEFSVIFCLYSAFVLITLKVEDFNVSYYLFTCTNYSFKPLNFVSIAASCPMFNYVLMGCNR